MSYARMTSSPDNGAHTDDLPLSGLRIVDMSTYVAGPSCGMVLAQLGADVIRIDPLGGAADTSRLPLASDGRSLYWAGLNQAKRSVEIDLGADEGREIVAELATAPGEAGGIVLTNAQAKHPLAYKDLRRRRGDLIYVQILGNADGSPAVDYTVNAQTGLPYLTGPGVESSPINHAIPVWDLLTGAHAAIGILAAERRRARTGRGAHVAVALADVAAATMAHLGHVADYSLNRHLRPRDGNYLYGDFGRDFETSDRRRVMVVVLTTRHWQKLIELTGTADATAEISRSMGLDFTEAGTRYQHRDVIASLIAPWFGVRDYDSVARALNESKMLWGPFQTIEEFLTAPGSLPRVNGLFHDVDHAGIGSYPAPRSVLTFDGIHPGHDTRPPALGEHTREVIDGLVADRAEAPAASMTVASAAEPSATFGSWTAREERRIDEVTASAASRLHNLLDACDEAPGSGDEVPPLWHWLAFLPSAPQRDLKLDGHPITGEFMPPVDLPHRMFAGGRLRFHPTPLIIGAVTERRGRVVSVMEKAGRSGRLVFVTVRYEIAVGGQIALTEEQDLVYREESSETSPNTTSPTVAAGSVDSERSHPDWSGWAMRRDIDVDERLLFRFSALTYNAHRIHYDRAWATAIEHYPSLVVQGPLQAIYLAELCRLHVGRPPADLTYRLLAPAFEPNPLLLRGAWDRDTVELAVFSGGRRTAVATVHVRGEERHR